MEYKDYLLEFYKVEAEKYNKTREIQWKLNLAIWTIISVAIYSKAQNINALSKLSFDVTGLAYTAYFALHAFLVIKLHRFNWTELNKNAKYCQHLIN